jgi:DNA primase
MNIKQIKETITCLDYLGKPAKKVAHGYLYHAPWREDKHPSLSVTPDGRGWHDLATGAKGSVIDLVMMHLNTRDFRRVIEELEKVRSDSFSFPQSNTSDGEKEKGLDYTRFELVPLQSRGLYAYLHKRGINIGIARQFLQEARYSYKQPDNGTYIYTLAYQNDKGGVEMRNSIKKHSKAPKWITTHLDQENAPVVVFEGFFDMLSFATLCGGVKHNYVCLNSIVNVPVAIEVLRSMGDKVLLCLDNDDGGDKATKQMLDALPEAKDIRQGFAPYKDVNEYLISTLEGEEMLP